MPAFPIRGALPALVAVAAALLLVPGAGRAATVQTHTVR